MDEASYILGVKICFSQKTTLKKSYLNNFRYITAYPLSIEKWFKTFKDKEKINHVIYTSAVGSFIYAILYTKPNINYVMGLVSSYELNPGIVYGKHLRKLCIIL